MPMADTEWQLKDVQVDMRLSIAHSPIKVQSTNNAEQLCVHIALFKTDKVMREPTSA